MATPYPVEYVAPRANPSVGGLYQAATLIDEPAPSRLAAGKRIRPTNCSTAFGTWDSDPCADPKDKKKKGTRPESLDFGPLVVWGYDQCDPTEGVEEVKATALQNMRLKEQLLVESVLGEEMRSHLTADWQAQDIVSAVSFLDERIAQTGTVGFIHAAVRFQAVAERYNLIVRASGSPVLRTPAGNVWVFGNGYNLSLHYYLIATGQPFVWRDEITQNSAIAPDENLIAAVAERTIVAGYECYIHGVKVDLPGITRNGQPYDPDELEPEPEPTTDSFIPGAAVPGAVVPG